MELDITGYVQWDSIYTALWKRQNHSVRKLTSVCQEPEVGLEVDCQLVRENFGNEGSAVPNLDQGGDYTAVDTYQAHQGVT